MTILSRTLEESFLEEIVWACNAKTHEGIWKPFFPWVPTGFGKTWAFWIYFSFLRIIKKHTQKKIPKTLWGDVVIILIVVIISQCISISNHQIIPFKYINILIIKYSSKRKEELQVLDSGKYLLRMLFKCFSKSRISSILYKYRNGKPIFFLQF